MEDNKPKEPELSYTTTFLMVGTALLFDVLQFLLQAIPIAGQILAWVFSLIAGGILIFWFYLHGIKFNTPKRLFSMGIGGLIEMIPVVNALPGWTIAVLLVIGTTKANRIAKIIPGGEQTLGAMNRFRGTLKN